MKELSYEENVQALDACIGKLQREDIPLEESPKVYQEALGYYKASMKILNELEGKLEAYNEETGQYEPYKRGE